MSRSHAADARRTIDRARGQVQRDRRHQLQAPDASRAVPAPLSNHAVAQVLGCGAPLGPELRVEMEARFGVDLGAVRIHDRAPDQQLAQQLSAKAFALGDHIAFNQGHYAPGTRDGKHLLAHELAHVIQQRRAGPIPPRFEGGSLEAAAERAASDVVGGSGPVSVSGASAVGVARQPLPQEHASDLPPPRSLVGSLRKSEDALSDEALHQEIDLIQQWLFRYPAAPGSDHLAMELDQLIAEDLSRTGQRVTEEARKPKPQEGSMMGLAGMVHQGHLQADEAAAAHRSYRATGLIPKTVSPLAPVEIKVGRPMSRSERYDWMLKLQHQKEPVTVSDLTFDELYPGEGRRDPEFLTHDEFKKEFYERYRKKEDECSEGLTRPDVRDRCLHNLQGEWGGEAFRAARDESYQRAYALWVHAQEQIESMKSGGLLSLGGRVGGYALGYATGHDPLRWSEYGADLGGMGDLGLGLYGEMSERARLQSYSEGGGLEVRRDADIHLILPRSPRELTPTPTPPGGAALPAFRQSSPTGSIGGPGPFGGSDPTFGGLLPAPIPFDSGKGLPQSEASKALEANLAKEAPGKAGIGVARDKENDDDKRTNLPAMSVLTQRPPPADTPPSAGSGGTGAANANTGTVSSASKGKGTLGEVNVPSVLYAGPEWNHIAGGSETATSRVNIARQSRYDKQRNAEGSAGIDFIVENVVTGELVIGEQKATQGGEFRDASAITVNLEKNLTHAADVLQQRIEQGAVKNPSEVARLQGTIDRLRQTKEALKNGREGRSATLPQGVTFELTNLAGQGEHIGPDHIRLLEQRYGKNPAFLEHLLSRTQLRSVKPGTDLKPGETKTEVVSALDRLSPEGRSELDRVKAGQGRVEWQRRQRQEQAALEKQQAREREVRRNEEARQRQAARKQRDLDDRRAAELVAEAARRAKLVELQEQRKGSGKKKPTKQQQRAENVEANQAGRTAKKDFIAERDRVRRQQREQDKARRDAERVRKDTETRQRRDEATARKAAQDQHEQELAAAHKEVDAMGPMTPESWGRLPKEQRQRLERLAAGDKDLAARLNEKVNAQQTQEWKRSAEKRKTGEGEPKRPRTTDEKLGQAAHRMNQAAGGIRAYDAYLDARGKGEGIGSALFDAGKTYFENTNPVLGGVATFESRMHTETLPGGRKQQVYGEDAGDAFFGTLGETIGGYIVPGQGWDQAVNGAANLIAAGDDHLKRGKAPGEPDKANLRTGTDLLAELTPSRMFSSTMGAGMRAYYDIGKAIGGKPSGVDKFGDDAVRGKLGSVIQPWAMAADFLGNLGAHSPGVALDKTLKKTEGTTLKKLGDAGGDALFDLGQSKEAKAGKYGPSVQGISMALGMTSDMIAGKSFEQALNDAADAGKGNPLEKAGNALGDAAFVTVEKGKKLLDKDLPEMEERAKRAYADAQRRLSGGVDALSDWWNKH